MQKRKKLAAVEIVFHNSGYFNMDINSRLESKTRGNILHFPCCLISTCRLITFTIFSSGSVKSSGQTWCSFSSSATLSIAKLRIKITRSTLLSIRDYSPLQLVVATTWLLHEYRLCEPCKWQSGASDLLFAHPLTSLSLVLSLIHKNAWVCKQNNPFASLSVTTRHAQGPFQTAVNFHCPFGGYYVLCLIVWKMQLQW